MRILVTGGAGFLGSHVVPAFLDAGHEVMVLDDLSTGKRENVPAGARFVLGDAASDVAAEAVRTFRPEVIDHLAGHPDLRRSVADPAGDARDRLAGLLRLLEAARECGVRKVILASSAAVYGETADLPADEAARPRPACPAGVALLAAESYLRYYRDRHGIEGTALRYANVYGPGQEPHEGGGGVASILADRLLRDLPAVIHGDGWQSRDFVFVGDAARANLAALDRGDGREVNVSTGVGTDVATLFDRLAALCGSGRQPVRAEAEPGGVRRSVLENRLAFEELGWYPEVSLDEGLARTVAYFREKNQKPDQW